MNNERIQRKLFESMEKRKLKPINSFSGEYRFLSNFYPSLVRLEGLVFPTVEHAFVAAKTINISKRIEAQAIEKPGTVKRFGRTLELREGWDEMKYGVMYALIIQKFRHLDLRKKLDATGDRELIEGNTWNDTYWGVCRGVGENNLGKILMKVREYNRKADAAVARAWEDIDLTYGL